MTTRRNFLKSGGLSLAGLLVGQKSFAHLTESATPGAPLVSNTLQYTCQKKRSFIDWIICFRFKYNILCGISYNKFSILNPNKVFSYI